MKSAFNRSIISLHLNRSSVQTPRIRVININGCFWFVKQASPVGLAYTRPQTHFYKCLLRDLHLFVVFVLPLDAGMPFSPKTLFCAFETNYLPGSLFITFNNLLFVQLFRSDQLNIVFLSIPEIFNIIICQSY